MDEHRRTPRRLLLIVFALLAGILAMHALTGFAGHGSPLPQPPAMSMSMPSGHDHAAAPGAGDTDAGTSVASVSVDGQGMGSMALCLAVLAGAMLLVVAAGSRLWPAASSLRAAVRWPGSSSDTSLPRPPSVYQLCVLRT